MKTRIKVLIAMLCLPLFVFAQEGRGQRMTPEQRAQSEAKRMQEQLALTDSQTVKYEKIALKYNEKRKEAFQNREDTAAMRQKMRETDNQMSEEVKIILSADQYTKYQQIIAERRNRMGKGPRPDGNGRGDR